MDFIFDTPILSIKSNIKNTKLVFPRTTIDQCENCLLCQFGNTVFTWTFQTYTFKLIHNWRIKSGWLLFTKLSLNTKYLTMSIIVFKFISLNGFEMWKLRIITGIKDNIFILNIIEHSFIHMYLKLNNILWKLG